jgi:hypothetical protein
VTRIAKQDLKCPNCKDKFTVNVPMSCTRAGTDTDFRPLYIGGDITELLIHTCHRCGFTGHEEEFGAKVAAEVSTLIAQRLTPLVRDERSPSWRSYEYAAWIAEWRRMGERTVAEYYLRASWCCRTAWGNSLVDTDEYYRRKAIEHFQRALDTGAVEADEIDVITYLIGELHRRAADFAEASRWLRQAVELADGKADRQWVADLATTQAALAEQACATPRGVRGNAPG